MHSAPSVSYPVGRSHFAAAFLLLAWLTGAGVVIAWCLQVQPTALRLLGASLLLGATGIVAAWNWWRLASGTLAWDGEAWRWAAHGAGTVSATLDLQAWLLVRWDGGGRVCWLWLERTACAERWDDLRRAVYFRARPSALSGAQPPTAET